jgi:hypothetical protein
VAAKIGSDMIFDDEEDAVAAFSARSKGPTA